MSFRKDFVLRAKQRGVNFTDLCETFGISRKTGYTWVRRFKDGGVQGLENMDRGPRPRKPLDGTPEMAHDIRDIRGAHPTWGSKKSRAVLLRKYVDNPEVVPSARSIDRHLRYCGLTKPRRPRRRKASPGKRPEVVVNGPNDLWTVDFKGWWMTLGGHKAEPLTIRDDHSKMVLAVHLVSSPSIEQVKAVFEDLFQRYGVPKVIQSDNGPPFAYNGPGLGLTRLSAWWLALGIRWVRSRPGKPQDNGAHERMHRTMKAEIQSHPTWTLGQQQDACDVWRHEFNHHRPHQSLKDETPASVYRRSSRVYPGAPLEPVYSEGWLRRKVSKCGQLRCLGEQHHVSNALAGYTVGVELLEGARFRLWFGAICLGVGTLPWNGDLRPPGPDVQTLQT